MFEGVEQFAVSGQEVEAGINIVELITEKTKIFPSKGEARKMIQGGGVSVNKTKVESAEMSVNAEQLINNKYMLVQKGKKNYYVIKVG